MPGPGTAVLDEPVDAGLRERKKRATRRALRLGALRLVAERGLENVTTDDVAAAAGVSPRTFFNYFASKEAALVGSDPDVMADIGRLLVERPADEDLLTALTAAFDDLAQRVVLDPEIWRLRGVVLDRHPALVGALVAESAELEGRLAAAVGVRTGLDPQRDAYPRLVAAVTVAAVRAAIRHVGTTGGDVAEQVRGHLTALRDGLAVPPAARTD